MGSTQYVIALLKVQHEENLKNFSEYQLVQRALIQQVLEAIDGKYLTRMRNRVTGQVPTDIRLLIMSLFTIYGKISAHKLKEKYDAVATMPYDIVEPIDTIFDAVDDLREIAELANRPYTATQMVDLGYIVVSQLPLFRSDVRRWLRKDPADQGWIDFQDHFTTAHQELRETQASVDEIGFQSANAIVSQIVDELRTEFSHATQPPANNEPPAIPHQAPQEQLALATTSPQEATMMTMFATMQANMEMMRLQIEENRNYRGGRGAGRIHRGGGRGGGRNKGRGGGRTSNRTQGPRRGHYCSTHGNCAHEGRDCNTPGPNHQPTASFTNMMGGNTRNCD